MSKNEQKWVKLTTRDCIHNGFEFKEGLNVDVIPFNTSGYCTPGGIYICEFQHILLWLSYNDKEMYWMWDVDIPDDAKIYKEPKQKVKCDKLILSNKRPIYQNYKEIYEARDIRIGEFHVSKFYDILKPELLINDEFYIYFLTKLPDLSTVTEFSNLPEILQLKIISINIDTLYKTNNITIINRVLDSTEDKDIRWNRYNRLLSYYNRIDVAMEVYKRIFSEKENTPSYVSKVLNIAPKFAIKKYDDILALILELPNIEEFVYNNINYQIQFPNLFAMVIAHTQTQVGWNFDNIHNHVIRELFYQKNNYNIGSDLINGYFRSNNTSKKIYHSVVRENKIFPELYDLYLKYWDCFKLYSGHIPEQLKHKFIHEGYKSCKLYFS
jgi:hypothetical protein